jgi:hypothetical protein
MKLIVTKVDYKVDWCEGIPESDFTSYYTKEDYDIDDVVHEGEKEGYIKSERYEDGKWLLVDFGETNILKTKIQTHCVALGVDEIAEELLD